MSKSVFFRTESNNSSNLLDFINTFSGRPNFVDFKFLNPSTDTFPINSRFLREVVLKSWSVELWLKFFLVVYSTASSILILINTTYHIEILM